MDDKERNGYRERLRRRFLAWESEVFSDEILLELLLTFAIARKDVRPIAQYLIRTFGGLSEVLSAAPDELCRVKGIGNSSIALLKAVNLIKTGEAPTKATLTKAAKADLPDQQRLFQSPMDLLAIEPLSKEPKSVTEDEYETSSPPSALKKEESDISGPAKDFETERRERQDSPPTGKQISKKIIKRKIQVSNGYPLEFEQLARVLNYLLEQRDAKRINRKTLREETGLADRHIGSLVSMGSAMGLIKPGAQVATPTGLLIARHDIFLEKRHPLSGVITRQQVRCRICYGLKCSITCCGKNPPLIKPAGRTTLAQD